MTPYYEQSGVTIYHGDCREILPSLGSVDHVITDPPYDEKTHAGARSGHKNARKWAERKASAGSKRETNGPSPIGIDFAALDDVSVFGAILELAKRWVIAFCALEQVAGYRDVAGEAWVRSGFWHRPDGAPQFTGDRPAQPGDAIAIMHRAGRKRWNGGGHQAFYQYGVERTDRVHPTQKPEGLMCELVHLFTDPGETILDPFMGSGTTLVAAKRLGRKAIGIEREEKYCEIAAKRLQQEALPLEVA